MPSLCREDTHTECSAIPVPRSLRCTLKHSSLHFKGYFSTKYTVNGIPYALQVCPVHVKYCTYAANILLQYHCSSDTADANGHRLAKILTS